MRTRPRFLGRYATSLIRSLIALFISGSKPGPIVEYLGEGT